MTKEVSGNIALDIEHAPNKVTGHLSASRGKGVQYEIPPLFP